MYRRAHRKGTTAELIQISLNAALNNEGTSVCVRCWQWKLCIML